MFKIDSSGATVSNTFTEGNPGLGVLPTVVSADWLNAVQGELVNVVQEAGIVLDKLDSGQLLKALDQLMGQGWTWRYAPGSAYASKAAFLAGSFALMGQVPSRGGNLRHNYVSAVGAQDSSLFSMTVDCDGGCTTDVICPLVDDEVLLYVNGSLAHTFASGSLTPYTMTLVNGSNTIDLLHRNTTNNSPGGVFLADWMSGKPVLWVRQ